MIQESRRSFNLTTFRKMHSKTYSTSCADTHHDVSIFEVDGMVQILKIVRMEHDFSM